MKTPRHRNLVKSLDYLAEIIRNRLKLFFHESGTPVNDMELPKFVFEKQDDAFTRFFLHNKLSIEEFLVILIGLAPHIIPNYFERLVGPFLKKGGSFPEFGGVKNVQNRYMVPSVSTALFILAGENFSRRLELMEIFDSEHFLAKYQVITLEEVKGGDPVLGAKIILDHDFVELFTKGRIPIPALSSTFPAKQLITALEWDDLIVSEYTSRQLNEIKIWKQYNNKLLYDWGMHKKLKPGYLALFYGPPGTGKTLAASLIGKYTNTKVLRVDLSQVTSKYIGETEKNLANLFKKAENKGWCLFFDEADSTFGKRSTTKDARDRYANQEVSYLLQRIENYQGLIILASNYRSNIDEAFLRRFNAVVQFPMPKVPERELLWRRAFPSHARISTDVDFSELARKYEMTGSNIMNTVQHACLQALAVDSDLITKEYVMEGIVKEFGKEGKVV